MTVREALRRKVQVNLLVFGVLLVVASYFISHADARERHRIIADLGPVGMQLIGTLLAVFLGAGLIAGDVERRVLYPVVAKPVARSQYLIGRYLGLAATLLLNLAVMAAALAAVLAVEAGSVRPLDAPLLAAFVMIGVQLLVVARGGRALLVASRAPPWPRSSRSPSRRGPAHERDAGPLARRRARGWRSAIWYALPNLGALNLNEAVIYHRPPPPDAWLAAGYGLLYAAATLSLACVAFERRDFR